jgi:hypothetical protein
MPTISRFYGIKIGMFRNDHAPPHFHAMYQDREVLIDIERLAVIRGSLPGRALALVLDWATEHQGELRDNWIRARGTAPLERIRPLE